MNIYLTTDTHFGHYNLIDYCGRPEGFEHLIAKGFKQLQQEDLLIHLGDICIGDDEKWHNMYIKTLPCKKVLVKGNHDKKSNTWYMRHGWDFVCESFRDTYYGKDIIFSHHPLEDLSMEETGADLVIHGHLHNKYLEPIFKRSNQILIALELNNYKLTSLKKLLAYPHLVCHF